MVLIPRLLVDIEEQRDGILQQILIIFFLVSFGRGSHFFLDSNRNIILSVFSYLKSFQFKEIGELSDLYNEILKAISNHFSIPSKFNDAENPTFEL